MKRKSEDGFVTIAVLGLAMTVFLVLNAVLAANYRLHKQNVSLAKEVQSRAERLSVRPAD